MTGNIGLLVSLAAEAAVQAAAAEARASRLKAAAVAAAEHSRFATGGSADRFTSDQQLGVLRLDGADKSAGPTVTDRAAFGSWLAEREPSAVTATITVPAKVLEQALDALRWSGIDVTTSAVTPGPGSSEFLTDQCLVQADVDIPGAWNVLHVRGDGATEMVDGVTATKPAPRWVLVPTSALKKQAAKDALAEAESDLAALFSEEIEQPASDRVLSIVPA
jgi:hypothetical protein